MKVLFLNHNQENYGTYYRCYFLGKYLSLMGHEVTMICASGKNFDLLIRQKHINDNFKIITLPRIKYHKYFTGQLLRLVISCFQALFYEYTLLHAFTVAQPQIGIPALIAKIRGKRVNVDWDDLWGGGFAEYHPFPIKQTLSFFEQKVPLVADRITLVSETLRQRAIEIGLAPQKLYKVPNGSNVSEIKPIPKQSSREELNLPKDVKIIVSVGNTYTKSINLLFDAFRLVVERTPNSRLIMVGAVEISSDFKQQYKKVLDKVVFTGPRPFKEIPLYLASADILALPMDDNPIEKARFPMRFGDYLASGRPIISNAVGEVKHYLEKYQCGLASEPTDTYKMAENIFKLLNDVNLCNQLGQQARQVAENILAWDKIVKSLSELYVEVER